jgi:hypothetical protein
MFELIESKGEAAVDWLKAKPKTRAPAFEDLLSFIVPSGKNPLCLNEEPHEECLDNSPHKQHHFYFSK